MKTQLTIVFAAVILSAAGIGLTMPILPRLLTEVGHGEALGWRFGAFLSLYALMQFIFSPILGSLSDRIGRKPVLLLSLAGSVVDYVFMALAPTLPLLFLGRAIAGITGATAAVASAMLTDITPEDRRARRFGQLSACFGVGFIAGPAIGGLVGEISLRAPFVAAAVLNAANLLLALVALRETKSATQDTTAAAPARPTARWSMLAPLLPLIAAYGILGFVGEIAGTVWVLYGQDKFAWDAATVGLSLAGFGLFHAVIQAFIVGPISERWGERSTLMLGMAADGTAYVLIALATQGWMAFALLPLFCVGGIGGPALQSMLTARVGTEDQGRLQGALASMTSLASIAAPLIFSTLYFATRTSFPGLVWICGAILYAVCLPLVFARSRPVSATE